MLQAAGQAFFQLSSSEAEDPKVSAFNSRLRGGFSDLMRRADGFADRRNNIAHGIVGHSMTRHTERGHYLTPPLYSTRKYPLSEISETAWERAAYAFTAADIHYYREGFEDLHDELFGLEEELRHWRRPRSSPRILP
jgi:hypothetical protein